MLAFRMPPNTPARLIKTMDGIIRAVSRAASSRVSGEKPPPSNRAMRGAPAAPSRASTAIATKIALTTRLSTRQASSRRPCAAYSANTGTMTVVRAIPTTP